LEIIYKHTVINLSVNNTHEKGLLMQVAKGDQKSFSILFESYHQQLGSYLFSITKDNEVTEEIVQEIFIKVWVNREELCKVNNFKAYLFTISKNRLLNFLRDKSREKVKKLKLIQDLKGEYDLIDADSVLDQYFSIIEDAVLQLPSQQQTIYHLIRHEKLKYDDIALKMGLSKETVRKHMHLALVTLKKTVRSRIEQLALCIILFYFF